MNKKDLNLDKECSCLSSIGKASQNIKNQIVHDLDRTFVINSNGVEIAFTLKKEVNSVPEERMKAFSILTRKEFDIMNYNSIEVKGEIKCFNNASETFSPNITP